MRDAVTLRLSEGRMLVLVDATSVQRWDMDRARYQLGAAVDDNVFAGHDLVRFADHQGLLASWDASVAEAVDEIARAFDRGVLVAIPLTPPWSGMRPSSAGQVRVDWDDLRPLADLRRPEPSVRPTRTSTDAPPVWLDPRDAWTSFEVVDDRGALADGEFRCLVDGEEHEGSLSRTMHAFRDISTSATSRLRVANLSFPTTALHLDGPVPGGTPTEQPKSPRESPTQRTTFEVVDDEGRPVVGRYVLACPDEEQSGPLAGVIGLDSPAAARLRIMLEPTAANG
jgi:hypothetical protein